MREKRGDLWYVIFPAGLTQEEAERVETRMAALIQELRDESDFNDEIRVLMRHRRLLREFAEVLQQGERGPVHAQLALDMAPDKPDRMDRWTLHRVRDVVNERRAPEGPPSGRRGERRRQRA